MVDNKLSQKLVSCEDIRLGRVLFPPKSYADYATQIAFINIESRVRMLHQIGVVGIFDSLNNAFVDYKHAMNEVFENFRKCNDDVIIIFRFSNLIDFLQRFTEKTNEHIICVHYHARLFDFRECNCAEFGKQNVNNVYDAGIVINERFLEINEEFTKKIKNIDNL